MASEAQTKAKRKYLRDQCKQMNLVFYPTESDISARVSDMHDKTGYIKDLIRRDIARDAREQHHYTMTEDMTTREVRSKAANILYAIGSDLDPVRISVEDARLIYARFMAARDDILPE